MEQAVFISLLSGLATGIGAMIVIWFGSPSKKLLGYYLGISSGMMGMVVLVDLLPSSLQYGTVFHTVIGFLMGITLMTIFDRIMKQFSSRRVTDRSYYRQMGYFMTLAIALHNLPEGLAIGAGFDAKEELGIRVALIIALHNIPEGLGVASTLFLGKLAGWLLVLLAFGTGLMIPVGTIISFLIGGMVPHWISIGLSIASGAMAYLVVKDIGPESVRLHPLLGKAGMMTGLLIMYLVYYLH